MLDYEDEDDRHTSVWILGAECGTSDGTILHRAFTCIVHIAKVRARGVMVIVEAQVHIRSLTLRSDRGCPVGSTWRTALCH